MLSQKAKYKAKVLVFWEKHGLEATLDAFSVKKATLYLWKLQLKKGSGKLESLNEKSKSPKGRRKRKVDERIKEFIIRLREDHPRLGKDKVKPLLDAFCKAQGIQSLSVSTIGRVVDDLKKQGKLPTERELSFHAKSDTWREKKRAKRKKLRRGSYQPEKAGDLVQIDTIITFINGIKRYIVTAIDVKSDFAFAYGYSSHSSQSATDFFQKLQLVAPFQIRRIQTDNGSEFEHYFRDYAAEQGIIHFHNYPKQPKMNAFVERFNRTTQEEFMDWNRGLLAYHLSEFNRKLIQWLLWYNTERPHYSLGQVPPMQYIINNLQAWQKSNIVWTHTAN